MSKLETARAAEPARSPAAHATHPGSLHGSAAAVERVRKRQRSERMFRSCGMLAISVGLLFVVVLFASIFSKGYPAFWQTELRLDIEFSAQLLGASAHPTPNEL